MTDFFWNYRISGDTKEHAARGVGPATDYATPYGTPVHAPFAGKVATGYSDARGHWISITSSEHGTVYICHLSKIGVKNGQSVAWRSVIGNSGNSGDVLPRPTPSQPYNGSHVHSWVEKGGKRYSFTEWLKKFVNTSSSASNPKPSTSIVGRELRLPSTFWYKNATDAKNMKNVHGGKYTGEPMLEGPGYIVLEVKDGSMKVHSRNNGNVWIHESLKQYLV